MGTPKAYAVALAAWEAMARHQTIPTPQNFAVWYSYYENAHSPLSHELRVQIEAEGIVTRKLLDKLYREYLAPKTSNDLVIGHTKDLQVATDNVVGHVAAGREVMREYSASLTRWIEGTTRCSAAEHVAATATLAASTAEAINQSATLEQRLSLSAARIAALQERLVEVERAACTDGLTGINNRTTFDNALETASAEASDSQSDLSLLLIDIDHFKAFNDNFGHRTGDQVLRIVAQQIAAAAPNKATAARYGGEEFAMILPGLGMSQSCDLAEKVRREMAERRIVNRSSGQDYGAVTVSIGVGVHRAGDDRDSLIERADRLLYQAKRNGRNRVCAELDD